MTSFKNRMVSVWHFYRDGFRDMTWGRPLVWLILFKIFILFVVLRIFFFKPAMAGLSDEERSRVVGEHITGGPSLGAAPDDAASTETYNL